MSLEELFYFVIGLMVIYMVYWQIFIANEDSHRKHNGIIILEALFLNQINY